MDIYNFERRLSLTKKSFDDLCAADESVHGMLSEQLDVFLMLARTITFVIQKDLSHKDGFKIWYETKQKEMAERFRHFVDMRNKVEKEDVSPVRHGTITIDFQHEGQEPEVVGTITHPDGSTEEVMGKSTHTRYFDKERKQEVISSCREYIDYLSNLADEATKRFPKPQT